MKNKLLSVFISLFITASALSQVSIKDSSIYTPILGISYGYYFPGGDMADRFGSNSSLSLNVDFKLRNYWILGVNGSYFFGKTIKESLFDSIATPTGGHITERGEFADVRLYERGFTVSGTIGRMFPFKKPNPNTGIVASIGVGYMQHKIRIETIGNNLPQLNKEYKKGYDKLTGGLLISENIGYMYLSNNRLLNFYIGLEFMQSFGSSLRSWDYKMNQRDETKRMDMLYGAKIGWMLPLYKKPSQDYYFY
jgi:hypothetical protein